MQVRNMMTKSEDVDMLRVRARDEGLAEPCNLGSHGTRFLVG